MARHLLDAICSGNERLAKDIILSGRYGCLDSQTSKRDGTALFFCCSRGLLELATLLVNRGASLDSSTKFLATPLHAAVDNNHFDIVRYLLDLGADLNAQTHRGDTPLHLAAYRGYTDIVHLLVQWGADVTVVNEFKTTPLTEAMRQGHCDIERYLKAIQDFHDSSSSNASSCHMVSLPPPTDLPSILPSQYKSPPPQPTSPKDFFQYKRPHQSHMVGAHASAIPCLENPLISNPTTNPWQRSHVSSYCLETDGLTSTELCGRVPEESIDPSVSLSMAVSNLCVPSHDRPAQRRRSSASSISMTSDCSNSGPRSDDSCTMSSISDVSSCGGDARREDFEASEVDPVNRCGIVAERRKSQPASTSLGLKSNESLISRAYSNPAPNSVSEFSDLYDSSLFSLGSLDNLANGSSSSSGSAPKAKSRETIPFSDVNSLYYAKDPTVQSFNCLSGAGTNNLSQPITREPVLRKEFLNASSCINDVYSLKQKRVLPIPPREQSFSVSVGEDCASTTWSRDNQPSNDLSSIRSSPSSGTSSLSSMTFINIPIQE